MSWMRENCPRLWRAQEAQRALLNARGERRRHKRDQVIRIQALVAHRELQYLRAAAIGRPRYVEARKRKLDAARSTLKHVTADLQSVDAWEPHQEAA